MRDGIQYHDMLKLGKSDHKKNILGQGCWTFGGAQWGGAVDSDSIAAMDRAYELGITHFDTASGYGSGHSERLLGQFIRDKRDSIFLASKQSANKNKEKYARSIRTSMENLGTDFIDLYYIHWPKSNIDMRPTMEALVEAKEEGLIGAIGVSNFSIEHMEMVAEVGPIDAHQLCYNLIWRWDEADIIPYCVAHGIAVVTYSSIAQGILTGKFPKSPMFGDGDERPNTTLFDPEVWPRVYASVEEMKVVAAEARRPLHHLAIRWVTDRSGVSSVLVGARTADQVSANVEAMAGEIDERFFDRLDEISDGLLTLIPDTGNIFRYYP